MGKFSKKNFSPLVYVLNDQRVMGIILRYVCILAGDQARQCSDPCYWRKRSSIVEISVSPLFLFFLA